MVPTAVKAPNPSPAASPPYQFVDKKGRASGVQTPNSQNGISFRAHHQLNGQSHPDQCPPLLNLVQESEKRAHKEQKRLRQVPGLEVETGVGCFEPVMFYNAWQVTQLWQYGPIEPEGRGRARDKGVNPFWSFLTNGGSMMNPSLAGKDRQCTMYYLHPQGKQEPTGGFPGEEQGEKQEGEASGMEAGTRGQSTGCK
ncbi:hypothetical protein BDK51DRAFT_31017 [Blyttiomyces helicus]|uniref:Uncharacterized protein n=1 Tax=Blyttiomyces helicus TaxID=388810 RepID=A0A4P9WTE3_9FUNG|nr:hypothetical protein BDK51DRAFT_31017 [Blyttiomyces helicus]|eukprot:RKO94620.1 hypothetical protein BDK51DRAFT_31017 [Blyttiomyces helicus]